MDRRVLLALVSAAVLVGFVRHRRPQLVGVSGMTMASNGLVYATTGALSTVDFSGGLPTGTATVVSGPTVDGQTWQSRGLLVLNLPT
jgi:hypothetical protein